MMFLYLKLPWIHSTVHVIPDLITAMAGLVSLPDKKTGANDLTGFGENEVFHMKYIKTK